MTVNYSHLWDGTEQLIYAVVSKCTWLKAAACEFVISSLEHCQEDLVVMVGVEQRTDTTCKLVKPGQSHTLLTPCPASVFAAVLTFVIVQLLIVR